jgi:hypothetical protein
VLRAFVPSPWRAVMRMPGDERSGASRSVRPRGAGGRRFGLAADVEPAAESRQSDRLIFGQLVTRGVRYWRRAIDQALAERGLSQATAMPLLILARLGDDLRQGG